MTKIYLATPLRERLQTMIDVGYPDETCGLMLGSQTDGVVRIADIVQARNLNTERAHDRFELDPQDFLKADQQARRQSREIVGIWHSHPDHPAHPSETDRVAAWEGYSYFIASVTRHGVVDLRSWRLGTDQQFFEEEIQA